MYVKEINESLFESDSSDDKPTKKSIDQNRVEEALTQ